MARIWVATLSGRATSFPPRSTHTSCTVPSTIALERATNPFLRADRPELAEAVGLPEHNPVEVFAEIRRRKDIF